MSTGLNLGIPLSDREDRDVLSHDEVPVWRRPPVIGAGIAFAVFAIAVVGLLLRDYATTSATLAQTAELRDQLDAEKSRAAELRAKMEVLFDELQSAVALQVELEAEVKELSGQRDRLNSELAAAKDEQATFEDERRRLSESLAQSQALVAQHQATIELRSAEIARLSSREAEPMRREPAVPVAQAPPPPVEAEASDLESQGPPSSFTAALPAIVEAETPVAVTSEPAVIAEGEPETVAAAGPLASDADEPLNQVAATYLESGLPLRKPQVATAEVGVIPPESELAALEVPIEVDEFAPDVPKRKPEVADRAVLAVAGVAPITPRRKPQLAAAPAKPENTDTPEEAEVQAVVAEAPPSQAVEEAPREPSAPENTQVASREADQADATQIPEPPVAEPEVAEPQDAESQVAEPQVAKPAESAAQEPSDQVADAPAAEESPQERPQIASVGSPGGPAEFLQDLTGKVMALYESNGVGSGERKRRLRALLHDSVDLTSMSKSILGSYWQRADPEDRSKYLTLVEGYLFKPLIRALEGDGVRGLKVLETGPTDASGTLVTTRLDTHSGQAHILGWKVQERGDAFKAVDLRTQGVSLFNVYESELESYAARNGVTALLETLQARDQVVQGSAQRVPGNQ